MGFRGAYIQLALRFLLRFAKPAHHRLPRRARPRVSLRIEEQLTIPHIHPRGPLEIIHRQIEIILFRLEHLEPAVIRLEERKRLLGVAHAAAVGGLHGVVVGGRVVREGGEGDASAGVQEGDVVAVGEVPFQSGGEEAFDVEVQVDFGEGVDEGVGCLGEGQTEVTADGDGEGVFDVGHVGGCVNGVGIRGGDMRWLWWM